MDRPGDEITQSCFKKSEGIQFSRGGSVVWHNRSRRFFGRLSETCILFLGSCLPRVLSQIVRKSSLVRPHGWYCRCMRTVLRWELSHLERGMGCCFDMLP